MEKEILKSSQEQEAGLCMIEPSELLDTFINKGILQEVNRVFFNPLGFILQIRQEKLEILKTNKPHGIIIENINKMQLSSYFNFAKNKHSERQRFFGFIIQTSSLLGGNIIEKQISDPKSVRLKIILNALDDVFYECKKLIMQESPNKDKTTKAPLEIDELESKLFKNINILMETILDIPSFTKTNKRCLNAINYFALLMNREKINNEIVKQLGENEK